MTNEKSEIGNEKSVDLLSITIPLKPVGGVPPGEAAASGRLPAASMGRAAHALLLNSIREADGRLAESLHDSNGLKPFTVSDLIGYAPKRGIEVDRVYSLRFTALTREVSAALQAAVSAEVLGMGREVELAGVKFLISDLRLLNEGRNQKSAIQNQKSTYEELSAPWLLGRQSPQHRIEFRFLSPTAFKSEEKHVPLPMPAWVFGSLLEKWNAFAPVALPPETRRFAAECMAVSGFRLYSRPSYIKEGGVRVGAVGMVRYTALNKDRYWLSVMNLLADFAFYAGVGAGTTMGLGQVRKMNNEQ